MDSGEADVHFRVTLSRDRRPHMTISVWAPDRQSAKTLALELHPEWEVVQARISSKQIRSEEA